LTELVFDGIKVADFSHVQVGPTIVKYLAAMGAMVIHIESKSNVDILRTMPPFKDGIVGLNRSAFFSQYNCNRYGIALNLNHPRGREVAKNLVLWADIVVESFSAGVMKKWGLDYESAKQLRTDIIYLSTTAQGQTGPRNKQRLYGAQLSSLVGLTHYTGWMDRGPVQPYAAYTDVIAPYFGAAALVAALDYRRATGNGQYLDLSQYEASIHFVAPLLLDYVVNNRVGARKGNRCSYAAPHNAYRCCGDDRWVSIAVFTVGEWEAFCQVIGKSDWVKDPRFATLLARKQNEDELDRLIGEWTINYTPEELMERMQSVGVMAGVVKNAKDINEDPQLEYRHHFQLLDHQEIGPHKVDNLPYQMSKTPAKLRTSGHCLGEHTEYVCTQILGIPDQEFIELVQAGVFE